MIHRGQSAKVCNFGKYTDNDTTQLRNDSRHIRKGCSRFSSAFVCIYFHLIKSLDAVSRPRTAAHWMHPLPRCNKRTNQVYVHTAPVCPLYTHVSRKFGSHTVLSGSHEIVDAAGLSARRLHVDTVVAQRMAELHSSLEFLK